MTAVNDIAIGQSIDAGESVQRTYEIEDDDLPTGRYVVEGSVGVGRGGGGTLPYRITFAAE